VSILIFLGPPGSGKGTQAIKLAELLLVPQIAVGDILREEVRAGSDVGSKAQAFMNAGKLVPDELTIEIVRQRVERKDCRGGFILDGFPRSEIQANALDQILAQSGSKIDRVIHFKIAEEEVVGRLSGRRSCKNCGAVYHLKYNPPRTAGKCDLCGGELYLRHDDEEEVIRHRFEVYEKQTRPLIDRYRKAGNLAEIDAARSIEAVFNDLTGTLAVAKAL
jgi:adenylate kinase